MIIFLSLITLFVLLIIVEILLFRYCGKQECIIMPEDKMTPEQTKQKKKYDRAENTSFVLLIPTLILLFVVIFSSIFVIRDNLPAHRDKILKEKALIIYKIENDEYESNSEMISAIDDFNDEVIKSQKALENPWISWFYSRHYKTINPIEYSIDVNGVTYQN